MNKLLIKQDINFQISKEEFLEDVDCLFEVLQASYGLYEYFGHERFMTARATVIHRLDEMPFEARKAVSILKKEFASFIKDGHFRIGTSESETASHNFAVRHLSFHGIPMIQCRKFYFDSPAEEKELEQFTSNYALFQNNEPLIIDIRDNPGGSDIYTWNFIKGLYGAEPDYSCRFVQKYSALFREIAQVDMHGIKVVESDGVVIKSSKPVYVWINENTASSAESVVAYFKTVENAVVVGTHTAGCFSCGNCITIYLPNSHLPIYFGTGMVLYEKTRNIDAEGGFQADISDEEFLRIIGKCEENGECPSFRNYVYNVKKQRREYNEIS